MAGLDPAIHVSGNRKPANNLMLSLTKHEVVALISGGRVKNPPLQKQRIVQRRRHIPNNCRGGFLTRPLDWKGAPVFRSEKTIRRARLMF